MRARLGVLVQRKYPTRPVSHDDFDSLVERNGKAGVFLLNWEGNSAKAKFLGVSLYRVESKDVWIVDGLSGGETIISEGAYFLDDGASVRVISDGDPQHGS